MSLTAKSGSTTLGAWSRVIDVLGAQNVLTGPTWVNNKNTQTYTSDYSGNWFERVNPQLIWSGAGTNTTTIQRIWPAGNYTVELRQEIPDASVLKRGRLSIEVCASCGPELFMASIVGGQLSPLFGAGPVLTWRSGAASRAFSFYDLFGMHESASPFATTAWLTGSGEIAAAPFRMSWSPTPSNIDGVDLYDFNVAPLEAGSYIFGFAVDPDLGHSAADDRAHYDAQRRLVYVTDSSEAFGILILDGKTPAAIGVQQFGAARLPPGNAAATIAAQQGGVTLFDRPDDVQFLISTAKRTQPHRWTVAFIRGRNAEEILDRSDALVESR